MIHLARGHVGPSIVGLQVMLRMTPPHPQIAVDGHFGPRTEEAVGAFQRQNRMGVSGTVDGTTWQTLLRLTGLQTIDAVDFGDLSQPQPADIQAAGGRPVVTYGQSGGVGTAIQQIMQRAGTHASIVLLRLHGHGAPGLMNLTAGTEWGSDHMAGISTSNFDQLRPQLQMLRYYFSPFGSVQLMGCSTGRGPSGQALLQRLADLWGVPVSAGTSTQLAGGGTTFRFEGHVRTAFPGGGNLASWARRVSASPEANMSRAAGPEVFRP